MCLISLLTFWIYGQGKSTDVCCLDFIEGFGSASHRFPYPS